ncbi:MAG: hypothetical protein ACRC2S_15155 [Waterburya sp.]
MSLAICFLSAYVGIWKVCNKFINNKIIKAIIIGIITPFLSFGFAINLISSIVYFFYVTDNSSETDTGGALLGLTFMFGIPASIMFGVINAFFVFLNKSWKDEMLQSMKNDVYNFLRSINSKNNK